MCENYVIIILSLATSYNARRVLRDIFWFFIYNEEKGTHKIAPANYLCWLLFFKVWKFGRISTGLKLFTAYFSCFLKFLSFIVKFFLTFDHYDGELRQKHHFLIAASKNDTKTKARQYSLIDCYLTELAHHIRWANGDSK